MAAQDKIMIFRSWKSDFNRGDILNALNVYTDEELAGIRAHGFNGIWLRGRYREMVTSAVFPEFGNDSKKYIDILNELVTRTAKHGVGVYIYVNEPAGFPATDAFWQAHPDVKGSVSLLPHHDIEQEGDEDYYSLCTSTEKVKTFLKDATSELFTQVPGLAGLITISASEYQTHCYAHIDYLNQYDDIAFGYFHSMDSMTCERCKQREPVDVVAEVNNLIHDGMVASGADAKLIAWNWSWNLYEPNPQEQIIQRLHKDIIVMADFERGGMTEVLGKPTMVDEYSIGYIGPSERASQLYQAAQKHGHQIMAKLQIGTTHELATVPSLPVISNVWQKVSWLQQAQAVGTMACWNFGNMRTLNTYIVGHGLGCKDEFDSEKNLHKLLSEYFPEICENQIALLDQGWHIFAKAMESYPFSTSFLYSSVMNYALGYWLAPGQIKGDKKVGRSWLMDERGDDFVDNFAEIGLDDTIGALKELAEKWAQGVAFYKKALAKSSEKHAQAEYANAVIVGCCFKSAYHVYSLYKLCSDWQDELLPQYMHLCEQELQNCVTALPYLKQDTRFGFHCECQGYQFDHQMVQRKKEQLEQYINQEPHIV